MSTSAPKRPRRAPSRLAMLAAACAGACGGPAPRTVSVKETVALTSLLDGIPGADSPRIEREGDHTDHLALLAPGERIAFEDLDLPPGVRVTYRVRALTNENPGPDALHGTLETVDGAGKATITRSTIELDGEPGDYWKEVSWRDESGTGLSSFALSFEVPESYDMSLAPRLDVGLLRPRASFEREVELRPTDVRRIVLVTMDTLRADHLGCYGHPDDPSPRIDELARESVLFESCYSTTNVTNPSHASIFTSLHLKDHDVKNNLSRLSADVPDMVRALAARGFRTAAFVSSHNFEPGVAGFDRLFQEFFPCRVRHRRAEDVNLELLPWLTENRERDFFVWVHYYDAHGPYDAPYPFNVRFPYDGHGRNPALGEHPPDWSEVSNDDAFASAQYLGEVAYLDGQFGLVLDHMRTLGMYDDALIVVTSDHGESLGEHGISCSHKGVHEATTRVPLLVKLPGVEPGVVRGLVSTLDVYPTLFDHLDLPIADAIRGASLLGLMETLGTSGREHVFSESAHGTQLAVRTNEFRAILGVQDTSLVPRVKVHAGRLELYESARDPAEQLDVSHRHAALARELRRALAEFRSDAMSLGAEAIDDEAFSREMEGLGYTDGAEEH